LKINLGSPEKIIIIAGVDHDDKKKKVYKQLNEINIER